MKVPAASILCPTDASPTGNVAVALAYRLAADEGVVHLVHICEPPYVGNPIYPPFVFGSVPAPESTTDGREHARTALEALVPASAKTRGVRTEVHLPEDEDASQIIQDMAVALDVDLVVMGTHGRGALGRLLLGSVASEVLRKCERPVVLARDVDSERAGA
jgi:nucleotide-binding universal stress UspA family protein